MSVERAIGIALERGAEGRGYAIVDQRVGAVIVAEVGKNVRDELDHVADSKLAFGGGCPVKFGDRAKEPRVVHGVIEGVYNPLSAPA